MTKQQEFRKQAEEAKFEAFSLMCKKVAELEKENAELKEWQKDTIKARGNDYMAWSRMKDQLSKAKEIIKDFLLMAKVEHLKDRYETVDEAEQFLKDSEV